MIPGVPAARPVTSTPKKGTQSLSPCTPDTGLGLESRLNITYIRPVTGAGRNPGLTEISTRSPWANTGEAASRTSVATVRALRTKRLLWRSRYSARVREPVQPRGLFRNGHPVPAPAQGLVQLDRRRQLPQLGL